MSTEIKGGLSVSQALIAELVTCSMDGYGKIELFHLAEAVALTSDERTELIKHMQEGVDGAIAEVEFVCDQFKPAAHRCLRKLKSHDDEARLPLADAFLLVFEKLPRGDEFHLLQFLKRVKVPKEGQGKLVNVIMDRVPSMKYPHHRELAFTVIEMFDGENPED
jgi:hypothetical protein